MKPNEAARALLSTILLPRGTVTVVPWPKGGAVVMHVYIEKAFMQRASIPAQFEGYDVLVEERSPTLALVAH